MDDFLTTRTNLIANRDNYQRLMLEVSSLAYRSRMLKKEPYKFQRVNSGSNEVFSRETELLEAQKLADKKLKKAEDELLETENAFKLFIDPQPELKAHFSNLTPFLLFPLRMETRFKTFDGKPQLWVRVYPDECVVDSFEQLLSKKEVNNAARFWAEYYSAGKADPKNPEPAVTEAQKAAWRLLVEAHGDGRAAWITRQLKPNEAKSIFPVRGSNTFILAIVTEDWNPTEEAVITGLFKQLWLAAGNVQLIEQIKKDFNKANPALDADTIIAAYRPVNFDDSLPPELKREHADLKVAIAVFDELGKKALKEHGWSQASRVNLLPERLALVCFKDNAAMEPIFGNPIPSPLFTSPDPSRDAPKQLEPTETGDLQFAESIRWVADFDRAVEIGMGFRIDLNKDELNGFDRILVLGVRLSANAAEGKKQLETLFDHHYFSKKGWSIIPQGTPTNNTDSSDSGFTRRNNPDETFKQYFKGDTVFKDVGFTHEASWRLRSDGQWLAEWLGLDEEIFTKVLNSGGRDQRDARNMNTALWPATMGYMMDSLMHPIFKPGTLMQLRSFFNSYVIGCGPVPTIRIGNQPYGILPTAAFKSLEWMDWDKDSNWMNLKQGQKSMTDNLNPLQFLKELYTLLLQIDNYWNTNKKMLGSVAHVAQKSTNVYQTLLNIITLHPSSVEFHRRYFESLVEMSNAMNIEKPAVDANGKVVEEAMNLLKQTFGYNGNATPQVASLLAHRGEHPVTPLIDDVPVSETKEIGKYTDEVDEDKRSNYIIALIRQALESEDAVRTGKGLGRRPDAELYRLLKYALELGYHTSAVEAVASAYFFSEEKTALMKVEQAFTHQEVNGEVTESRYSLLYQTIPKISENKNVAETIRDFIQASIEKKTVPEFAEYISSQIAALGDLADASTARLERAFVGHLDCCSYRLDAWKTAIITNELFYMRGNSADVKKEDVRKGIFLGAFGWLENVRPNKNKIVKEKTIPAGLTDHFNPGNNKVFLTDNSNEGYIHAPSLNQAVTAAILRNGYISHGKVDGNAVLAVNLSSERTRLALSVIEGIQGGQSLAALLGYYFERNLHDRKDLTEKKIDSYIYALRKIFPLVAGKLKDTAVDSKADPSIDIKSVPITAIEARHVIHGVNLVNHVKSRSGEDKTYPFGLTLIHEDPIINRAITDAVNEIMDIADAVADMGIAESVHHMVMGNNDRAAGVLETYSKGNYPQEPDVIRTPRSGATLTHRVGIPLHYIPESLDDTTGPRAKAEPSINKWLSDILPTMDKIVCICSYNSRKDGPQNVPISLQDIGLDPIDLLYAVHTDNAGELSELDDRFICYLHSQAAHDPRLDMDITINHTAEPSDTKMFSVFQVMPLVRSLRALILESVPLTPADIALPNEANKKDTPPPELPRERLTDLITDLKKVLEDPAGIIVYLNELPPSEKATEAQLNDIADEIDNTIKSVTSLFLDLGRFGIPQTGVGAMYVKRQQLFGALKKKLQKCIDRWQKKLEDYILLEAISSPPSETLQEMERLISSSTTPADFISVAIVKAKKENFQKEFSSLQRIAIEKQTTLIDLIRDLKGLNTAAFDIIPFDIKEELRQIPIFVYDLQVRLNSVMDDLEKKRIPDFNAMTEAISKQKLEDQAKLIEASAQIILGENFKMVPRYALPAAQQAEIANSWNAKDRLLNYLHITKKRMNPTEDWLHGMARVHEKMKHLENCLVLRSAFGLTEEDFMIHPVQLPFKTEKYHWLAMPFNEKDIDLEKGSTLLYTAFTSEVASAPTEICGILVDEWTELIPAREETTGITFQYDRPNSEAPQALLLVTPTKLTGNWQWSDLVDALSYTLDAAKSRAIEPGQIDETKLAAFLPAVFAAESLLPYNIVLDNKVHYFDDSFFKNNKDIIR